MTEGKTAVGRRRLRLVRLRPETTSGAAISTMTQQLSSMLGLGAAQARGLLVRLGRLKPPA